MLSFSGFELYSRWLPLTNLVVSGQITREKSPTPGSGLDYSTLLHL